MDEAGLFGMQQCESWRAMKKLVCVGLVLASVAVGRAASTNANLGAYIGTNTLPVVTAATARTWYSGPGDFALRWDTRASAAATVAYVFDGRCDKDDDGDKDGDKDGGGR